MAFFGKLRRGMKWDFARDSRGNLPKNITEDKVKMEELDFFLSYVKDKNKDKVFDVLKRKNLRVYFKKRKLDPEEYLKSKIFVAKVEKAKKE